MRNKCLNAASAWTALAGVVSLASCHSEKKDVAQKHPNILFIFTDQQTLRDMGAYGNPYVRTPYMDDLARFGVRFTKSYCTSPLSSPSRSSILTSRMAHETGVVYNGNLVDSTIINMGQLFKSAGYNTYYAGKWHLPEDYPAAKEMDSIPGFKVLPFEYPQRVSGFGSITDPMVTDAAVKFLKSKHEGPFLLAVSLHNPHDICAVPGNHNLDTLVNVNSAPPLPFNFYVDPNEPEFVKDCRVRKNYGPEVSRTLNYSRNDWRKYLYHYYRLTELVDQQIGRIIEALEYAALEENTLVIFTSDHGDGAASHKWAVKLSLYEEPVTVPFIVTWFGKTPVGKVDSTHMISGLDILPTMLDYAGLSIPESLEGKSIKSIIEDPSSPWRDYVVSELAPDPDHTDATARMIRSIRYKYIVYSYGRNPEQLFDLQKDPGEMNNLALNPSMKPVMAQHRAMLEEHMKKTTDTFQRK